MVIAPEMYTGCTADYLSGKNLAVDGFRNLCALRFLGCELRLSGCVGREATGMHQGIQSWSRTASTKERHCSRWLSVVSTVEPGPHRSGCAVLLTHVTMMQYAELTVTAARVPCATVLRCWRFVLCCRTQLPAWLGETALHILPHCLDGRIRSPSILDI